MVFGGGQRSCDAFSKKKGSLYILFIRRTLVDMVCLMTLDRSPLFLSF